MKFALYLIRWQLSTPILYAVVKVAGADLPGTIIANLIGGCVFYFVDRKIFKNETHN